MTKVDLQPLALTQTADGRQAVQCSTLYKGLGLDLTHYTRWVRKNILNNVFAEIGTDYLPLSPLKDGIRNKNTTLTQPNVEIRNKNQILTRHNGEIRTNGNTLTRPNGEIRQTLRQKRNRSRSMDFILTLDFAKKLAMMTRTAQGESVRRYFLHCEKIAKQKTELIQTELFAELEAYRSLEAIRLQRRELNRQARKHRERIKQAQATIKQLKYIQLTFNFNEYAN